MYRSGALESAAGRPRPFHCYRRPSLRRIPTAFAHWKTIDSFQRSRPVSQPSKDVLTSLPTSKRLSCTDRGVGSHPLLSTRGEDQREHFEGIVAFVTIPVFLPVHGLVVDDVFISGLGGVQAAHHELACSGDAERLEACG